MTFLIILTTAYIIAGMYSSVLHNQYNEKATTSDYVLLLAIWPYVMYLGFRKLYKVYKCRQRQKFWE